MTCGHRHLSAIPGGRFACSDDLNCRSVFTLTTDGEVEHLRARYAEGLDLIEEGMTIVTGLIADTDRLTRQRDAARDAARICEQTLADADSIKSALTTRVNTAEPKLEAWRRWGSRHGYGLGPEAPDDETTPAPSRLDVEKWKP